MDEIIKKAIEGGYLDNGDRYVTKIDGVFIGYNNSIVLDSIFWQALGKACGWGNTHYIGCNSNGGEWQECGECDCSARFVWRENALRFYEINLTGGWNKAVTYLTEVTNMKKDGLLLLAW